MKSLCGHVCRRCVTEIKTKTKSRPVSITCVTGKHSEYEHHKDTLNVHYEHHGT